MMRLKVLNAQGLDMVSVSAVRHTKIKGRFCTGVNASKSSPQAARHSSKDFFYVPRRQASIEAWKRRGVTHSCQVQLGRAST